MNENSADRTRPRQRSYLLARLSALVVLAVCGVLFYVFYYPAWRADWITAEVETQCHVDAVFPEKLFPQSTHLMVFVDEDNNGNDIASLTALIKKKSYEIERLSVAVDGEAWQESDFTRLLEAGREINLPISVYISHLRAHMNSETP